MSHSFLKHPELDGILDMASDRIEMNLARVSAPVVWVKMTTIAFRWEEVAAVYEQQGYEVYPLLIFRRLGLIEAQMVWVKRGNCRRSTAYVAFQPFSKRLVAIQTARLAGNVL